MLVDSVIIGAIFAQAHGSDQVSLTGVAAETICGGLSCAAGVATVVAWLAYVIKQPHFPIAINTKTAGPSELSHCGVIIAGEAVASRHRTGGTGVVARRADGVHSVVEVPVHATALLRANIKLPEVGRAVAVGTGELGGGSAVDAGVVAGLADVIDLEEVLDA